MLDKLRSCRGGISRNRGLYWAYIHAAERPLVQVLVLITAGTVKERISTGSTVLSACNALAFIKDRNIDRARLVALIFEEEILRVSLVTAHTVCQTPKASLTWPLAEFARTCLVNPVVSSWAYVHARVA